MCTQSSLMSVAVIPRPTTPEGTIPSAYFHESLLGTSLQEAPSCPVTAVASAALSASTASMYDKEIEHITSNPKVVNEIRSQQFMNQLLEAVEKGTSLEPFKNQTFEIAPRVYVHHLHVVISHFSSDAIRIMKGFRWIGPYNLPAIIYENMAADFKENKHLRSAKYPQFILELIETLELKPYFFHMFYLTEIKQKQGSTVLRADCNIEARQDLPILRLIQETYGFSGASLIKKLTFKELKKVVKAAPYLQEFGIKDKDTRTRLEHFAAQLKAQEIARSAKFLKDFVEAVENNWSLSALKHEKFPHETAPLITQVHIDVVVNALNIDALHLMRKFTWEPPYILKKPLFNNLATAIRNRDPERIEKFKLFLLECTKIWNRVFFHVFYLCNVQKSNDYDCVVLRGDFTQTSNHIMTNEDLPILEFIQKTHGFTGAMILEKMKLEEVEFALECPYYKNFGLTEKAIKARITELIKVNK